MRALPTIQPAQPGETLYGYGCRVLAFVLATDCTATLSDHDLELADHVYPVAIAHPEIMAIAVDRLTAVRSEVLAAIARRRRLAELDAVDLVGSVPPKGSDRPGGRLSPLQPQPIVRPPSDTAVREPVDIRF